MKHLYIAALCLCLSACYEGSSSPQVASAKAIDLEVDTPAVWTAPMTVSAAEQEFRGTYTQANKPANSITIDSSFNASGSMSTYQLEYLSLPQLWVERPAACTFTASKLRAEAREAGKWLVWMQVDSASHSANSTIRDCVKMPAQAGLTDTSIEVRFISESCVGITFSMSTGEKQYCKVIL